MHGEDRARRPNGQFRPGVSGNPHGRPPGRRNRVSQLASQMLEADAEEILDALVTKAKAGEPRALKLAVERLAPRPRSQPAPLDLPEVTTAAGVRAAQETVIQAAAAGDIDLDQARAYARLLDRQRQALETEDLARRLEAMEKAE